MQIFSKKLNRSGQGDDYAQMRARFAANASAYLRDSVLFDSPDRRMLSTREAPGARLLLDCDLANIKSV